MVRVFAGQIIVAFAIKGYPGGCGNLVGQGVALGGRQAAQLTDLHRGTDCRKVRLQHPSDIFQPGRGFRQGQIAQGLQGIIAHGPAKEQQRQQRRNGSGPGSPGTAADVLTKIQQSEAHGAAHGVAEQVVHVKNAPVGE